MFYLLPDCVDLLRIRALVLEGPLGNYLSSVQGLVNPMDGYSVNLHSVSHGGLHRVGP